MAFKRGNPGCCGCPPPGQICITAILGCADASAVLNGATVTLNQPDGSTQTGNLSSVYPYQACFTYTQTGTYTYTVTPNASSCWSYQAATGSVAVTTGNYSLRATLQPSPGWSCCSSSAGSTNIPYPTNLYLTFACGPTYTLTPNGSNTCQWINGSFSVSLLTNCQWQLNVGIRDPYGNSISCSSTATGPPTTPVNLSFGSPSSPYCLPPYTGCASVNGSMYPFATGSTANPVTIQYPATVTS